jgi:hypothetical protein
MKVKKEGSLFALLYLNGASYTKWDTLLYVILFQPFALVYRSLVKYKLFKIKWIASFL